MFKKVQTITSTGNQYEKQTDSFFYTIQEDGQIIDEDKYALYLDWIKAGNTPELVSGERFLNISSKGKLSIDSTRDTTILSELWTKIRSERDILLLNCDWTQLLDAKFGLTDETAITTKKVEWQTYRQALRDITTQKDPSNITWPNKPE